MRSSLVLSLRIDRAHSILRISENYSQSVSAKSEFRGDRSRAYIKINIEASLMLRLIKIAHRRERWKFLNGGSFIFQLVRDRDSVLAAAVIDHEL